MTVLSGTSQDVVVGSITHAVFLCHEHMHRVLSEYERPCVVFKPRLTLDGNAWIACFGEDLQVGVVGTGNTPDAAMRDFDRAWYANK